MKLLNEAIIYLIVDLLNINDILNFKGLNKYINLVIKKYNIYWSSITNYNKILDIEPYYNYLYCHRFISFSNISDINKINISFNKKFNSSYEKVFDKKSVSKYPLILYTGNSFCISISTKIKISGNYKVIWLIKMDRNSFISNLHVTTLKQSNKQINFNLINERNEFNSKLIDTKHYKLYTVYKNENFIYNYFNISDQHKIRNKGWFKLSTDNIYLKKDEYIKTSIQNQNNIFFKYKIDGIFVIRTS